jgi:glycosyltransferase involved in cell wall biosynthesis
MKIIIINQHISDYLGGSELQCDIVARGLSKKGHDVIYGAVNGKKDNYSGYYYNIVPLLIKKRKELANLLEKEKPDVIYWRYNKNYLLRVVKESRKRKIPFVFAVSHINDTKLFAHKEANYTGIKKIISITKQILFSVWNFRAFNFIDAVIFQLSNQKRKSIVKKKRSIVIWNSAFIEKKTFSWKKQYCLWVANIKSSKQPEKYIKIAEEMIKKYPEIDFLMMGSIQAKKYESVIEKTKKLNNFHYLGKKSPEEVNGALKNALCLFNTCKKEGFPNNMIQAWTQGCPVISLEYDPDNLIKKEKMGFISGNSEQMIFDIEKLIKNKNLRDEIGERAQKFAHKNFTQERMIRQIEEFLQELLTK